jgi:hypothetical protein
MFFNHLRICAGRNGACHFHQVTNDPRRDPMGTKVMALAMVMGAAGALPVDAQIGERAGRATGTVAAGSRDSRTYEHCWEEDDGRRRDDRDVRCDDWQRSGTAIGRDSRGGRYDERDARRDGRYDARAYRVVRAHDQLHDRLDRLHRDWHRHRGWYAREGRWRRDHAELHRRLDRTHAAWHREAGWRADHRDSRWDRRN